MKFRSFPVLYHVGTMNPADKAGQFTESWEGHGLSVSEYPYAWCAIAQLGGLPFWRLTKPENKFLDFGALTVSQKKKIHRWGFDGGWVAPKTVWVHEYYDDEYEVERFAYFDTAQEAEDELEELGGKTFEREIVVGTPKLAQLVGYAPSDMGSEDMLAVAYASLEIQADGVFWDDEVDVLALMAPRAVIFPEKLGTWVVAPIDESDELDVES